MAAKIDLAAVLENSRILSIPRTCARRAWGWALGVGRLGAIVGPYVGGTLIANRWTTQQLFLAAAVPAAVSMAMMMTLRPAMKHAEPRQQLAPIAH